jgi:two-component system, chemotaxis family, chemotaxis protein CheY
MKVLIVDDEAIARTALREALATQGRLKFEEFEDGEAAWQALDKGLAPSLCFFDVRMAKLSGVELLERLRRDPRFSGLPVILVTASVQKEVVVKASTLGLDGLVIKPIEARLVNAKVFPILNQFIETLLGQPGKVRQKLGMDHGRYIQTLEGLLRKGSEAIATLRGIATDDSDRIIHGRIASMRTTAGALGASHLDAALGRAITTLTDPLDDVKRKLAAGTLDVGLTLLREALEWQNITVKV